MWIFFANNVYNKLISEYPLHILFAYESYTIFRLLFEWTAYELFMKQLVGSIDTSATSNKFAWKQKQFLLERIRNVQEIYRESKKHYRTISYT